MNEKLFEELHRKGLISDDSLRRVKVAESTRLFSLHWELKTLLYLGVLLLAGGLGTLIYKNLDTIGHLAVIGLIAAVSAGCFYYCIRHKRPFSWHKVLSPNLYFDYVLLLGCLTLVSFITYLQAQYGVFGHGYGASTFIPMLILFFSAYYFDHIGVLSLAITNLAAWAGIALTPLNILTDNNFGDQQLIFYGMALGVLLIAMAYFSRARDRKQHFIFTYANFGVHMLCIALLAAEIYFDSAMWFVLLVAASVYFILQARKEHSFYFILITVAYVYIGLTIAFFLWMNDGLDVLTPALMYFLVSAIGVISFLTVQYKSLKKHDRI